MSQGWVGAAEHRRGGIVRRRAQTNSCRCFLCTIDCHMQHCDVARSRYATSRLELTAKQLLLFQHRCLATQSIPPLIPPHPPPPCHPSLTNSHALPLRREPHLHRIPRSPSAVQSSPLASAPWMAESMNPKQPLGGANTANGI